MGRRILFAFAATLAMAFSAGAQQPGPLTQVHEVEPKPGMRMQLEEGAKRHVAWHRAQNDTWEYHVYEVVTGEDTGSYVAVYPGRNWADYDGREAFMAQDIADAEKNIFAHAQSYTSVFWVIRPDLSVPPPGEPPSNLISVSFYQLKPGASAEFEAVAKRIAEAIRKTNWPTTYIWYTLVNGGEQPTYAIIFPRDNWAGLAPPEKPFEQMLEEGLGRAEAAATLASIGRLVRAQRSHLLVYRQDLSYIPAGQ